MVWWIPAALPKPTSFGWTGIPRWKLGLPRHSSQKLRSSSRKSCSCNTPRRKPRSVKKSCAKPSTRKKGRQATLASSLRASLPRHRQLRALRVKDPTLVQYNNAVVQFESYCRCRRWTLSSPAVIDKCLANCFTDLYEDGEPYNKLHIHTPSLDTYSFEPMMPCLRWSCSPLREVDWKGESSFSTFISIRCRPIGLVCNGWSYDEKVSSVGQRFVAAIGHIYQAFWGAGVD